MLKRLFLSVGAMKAGTTWLYEQLKGHPEIYFTPEKEIHYFANAVGIENQLNHRSRLLRLKSVMEKYAKGNPTYISNNISEIEWYLKYASAKEIDNQWYESLFSGSGNRMCADFSNLYCQMESDGWKNVRATAQEIKAIYTLRNPLDRIWSHYKFHLKWTGRENDVLNLGLSEFKNTLDKNYFWINAQYAQNVTRLRKELTDSELMVLYFDDFRKFPEKMLNDIQKFLGVSPVAPDEGDLEKKVNRTKDIPMPLEWKEYALKKLEPEIAMMKDSGLWLSDWNS